ncbi:UNVERIFIED_CONTAM: hypothetical protein Sindi_2306200 [Sesamum indicum]
MENTAVSHFMMQPKLTSRQACWQELLSEFQFVLEYRAGSNNHAAEALSHRADLATFGVVAALSSTVVATSIRDQALKCTVDDQEKSLICAQERTYASVQRAYYWPQMLNDVEAYVHTCLICQQDKEDHQKKAGLLQPLPIPKRPWEMLMDYISGLPTMGDLGSIIVVADRL